MLSDQELGQYLQDIRKRCGLSLRRVNELKGISYSHLNMIEHGKRGVTPALLKNLAELYKIDYLDLYEKAGYIDLINSDEKIAIAASTKGGIDLSEICDEDKETLMNIYNMMRNKKSKDKN